MYFIIWLIIGGVIGWLASLLTGNDYQMGIIANVVVGLLGAILGGAIANFYGIASISIFSWTGFGFAILGSVILLFILNAIRNGARK